MIGLLLAVAVAVGEAGQGSEAPAPVAGDTDRQEAAKKAVEALANSVPAPEAEAEVGATMEFYWAPAPVSEAPAVEAPAAEAPVAEAPAVEAPVPAEAPAAVVIATGFHSEVEVFRVAASARGRGEAQRLLDATVEKLVAKGVDRSRIETDVSIGPRKVRIQIVKVKNVVRNTEGSSR